MIQEHAAAVATVTSCVTAVSTFTLANEIAQFCAAIVAIISGIAAAYYYFKKAKKL